MRARLAVVALLAGLLGCELTEITLNPGKRTVVVQSILNRDTATQFAVIEYSFNGDTTGRTSGRRVIPTGRPQFPVVGARAILTYPGPGPCSGRNDTLFEVVPSGTPLQPSGRYQGVPCALQPGGRARLTVKTAAGEIVTGETVMPGIANRRIVAGVDTVRFEMDTLSVWKERDTIRIAMDAAPGRAIQVEARPVEDLTNLVLYLFSDSLGMALAGNLVNPFEDDGTFIFHSGRFYRLAVVLGDTNYFDYVRSISDPVTGRGYINHIRGGYGVFGSVDMEEYILRVIGDQHDPREGTYRFTGTVANTTVDLSVELFLDRDPGYDGSDEPLSGFVRGVVTEGAIDQSGVGVFGTAIGVSGSDPNALQFNFQFTRVIVAGNNAVTRRYSLNGIRAGGLNAPFSILLRVTNANNTLVRSGTVTGRQTQGPISSGQP